MKHSLHIPGGLMLIALCAAPAAAQPSARVRHVPPSQAEPAEPLKLTAFVDRGWESSFEIRYRPQGSAEWKSAAFTRQDQATYVATIPAQEIAPPGLEYFIVSTDEAQATHFASSERPHRVNVFRSPKEVRRVEQLARHDFRRAQIRLAGEWVDYGSYDHGDDRLLPDRYYRIDADVGYRVLSLPLKTLRFGYTHLLGEVPRPGVSEEFLCPAGQTVEECSSQVGFKGGGWFELGFLITEGVELDARGMVMATQTGFNVGGRAELRIGDSLGTHLGLGAEHIADVGSAGLVRLAWGTVPGVPMAATVEVSNFPASERPTAVRLVYDIARPFSNGFRIGARVGYQARSQQIGGATLGLNTALEF
jgi:hypothetical protein